MQQSLPKNELYDLNHYIHNEFLPRMSCYHNPSSSPKNCLDYIFCKKKNTCGGTLLNQNLRIVCSFQKYVITLKATFTTYMTMDSLGR